MHKQYKKEYNYTLRDIYYICFVFCYFDLTLIKYILNYLKILFLLFPYKIIKHKNIYVFIIQQNVFNKSRMFINPVNLRYLSKCWVVYEPCTNGQQIQKAYKLIFKQIIKLSLTIILI